MASKLAAKSRGIVIDPFDFLEVFWPDVTLFGKQVEVIESVRDNDQTYVPAGNMLGKDFVAGFIILWYFLAWDDPHSKVVTTSTTQKHLDILWGEIDRFLHTSRVPLLSGSGGNLVYGSQRLERLVDGVVREDTYVQSVVTSSEHKGEGMSGHHSPHSLFVCDEASGVSDKAYEMAQGWAHRMLILGNPNPCRNFFYRGVEEGDLLAT